LAQRKLAALISKLWRAFAGWKSRAQVFTVAAVRSGINCFAAERLNCERRHTLLSRFATGLQILAEVREKFGLVIVTEAMDERVISISLKKYADCIQIGARNSKNFSLPETRRSFFLVARFAQRGMSATLDDLVDGRHFSWRQ